MRISDWSSDVCSSDLTQILGQMLGSISRPSALFCSNDLLATAVIVGLRQLGYSVPEDISVAGFDGIRYGTVMSPSLTRSEERRVGEECVSKCKSRWSSYHKKKIKQKTIEKKRK